MKSKAESWKPFTKSNAVRAYGIDFDIVSPRGLTTVLSNQIRDIVIALTSIHTIIQTLIQQILTNTPLY